MVINCIFVSQFVDHDPRVEILILKKGEYRHLCTLVWRLKKLSCKAVCSAFLLFFGGKVLLIYTKTVPVDLNMKFISKFNHGFTNHGCLHYAPIKKALYGFNEKRVHKVREMQFFLQNVQNVIFKTLKMSKNNIKFIRAAS